MIMVVHGLKNNYIEANSIKIDPLKHFQFTAYIEELVTLEHYVIRKLLIKMCTFDIQNPYVDFR